MEKSIQCTNNRIKSHMSSFRQKQIRFLISTENSNKYPKSLFEYLFWEYFNMKRIWACRMPPQLSRFLFRSTLTLFYFKNIYRCIKTKLSKYPKFLNIRIQYNITTILWINFVFVCNYFKELKMFFKYTIWLWS